MNLKLNIKKVSDDAYIKKYFARIMLAGKKKDYETLDAIINKIYEDGFSDGQNE